MFNLRKIPRSARPLAALQNSGSRRADFSVELLAISAQALLKLRKFEVELRVGMTRSHRSCFGLSSEGV